MSGAVRRQCPFPSPSYEGSVMESSKGLGNSPCKGGGLIGALHQVETIMEVMVTCIIQVIVG